MRQIKRFNLDELAMVMPTIPETEMSSMIGGTGSVTLASILSDIQNNWNSITGDCKAKMDSFISTIQNGGTSILNFLESFSASALASYNETLAASKAVVGELLARTLVPTFTNDFEEKMFNIWRNGSSASGNILSPGEQTAILNYATTQFFSAKNKSNVTYNGVTYTKAVVSFYDSQFRFGLGDAEVYFDSSGTAVGLKDNYDFNRKGANRSPQDQAITVSLSILGNGGFYPNHQTVQIRIGIVPQ